MDGGVVLEDVHLLNAGDGVHPQALEGGLQPLVVSGGGFVHSLLLPEHACMPTSSMSVSFKRAWMLDGAPAGGTFSSTETKFYEQIRC